jgi:hypothetical protein
LIRLIKALALFVSKKEIPTHQLQQYSLIHLQKKQCTTEIEKREEKQMNCK